MKILNILYTFVFIVLLSFFIALLGEKEVSAESIEVEKGAVIKSAIESAQLNRTEILYKFFKKRNSPMAENSKKFVEVADKYGLDYRLLPAISCLESSCGIRMPYESYNAWGWGVYGTNVIKFQNFDDGIEQVAKGLYEGYVLKGANTPEKIAPIYNPPTHESWLGKVKYYMAEIDKFAISEI